MIKLFHGTCHFLIQIKQKRVSRPRAVRLLTGFSLILQQTTWVVVTYIIASTGFRSLMYASWVYCFQPPKLIENLSTFRDKRIKKVVPKFALSLGKRGKNSFFLFCFIAQIFKHITSIIYTLVSYLLYISFANHLSLFLSLTWLFVIHDWWSKTRGRIFER